MKNNKKISLILAVYNIEKYISKCLDSVIKQKGKDIEILIIDDGSTDNSLKICQEYQKKDDRINIIHQENQCLSISRNVGIENANGEYIWFIDGDDYIEEDSVDTLRKYLDKYDIIFFNYNSIHNEKIEKTKDCKKYDNVYEKYLLSYVVAWNKVFKRSIFNNDRFPKESHYNDIYIIPSLVYKTDKVKFIDEYLYNYVYRDNSLSNTRPFYLEDYLSCIENVYSKVKEKYPEAGVCFYINQLLVYKYAKEIRYGEKYDYRKLNKILKGKFPKYYKNKYYNNSLSRKIYIRLVYWNITSLVKLLTYIKFRGRKKNGK